MEIVKAQVRAFADQGLRLYRWRAKGLRGAAAFVEEMWADRLARLKQAAEREEWPERARRVRGYGTPGVTEPQANVVEMTLRIAARPETVWRYWTDPERMREWWGAAELDPQPGGDCIVEMGGGGVMRGTFLELVPHERIVFTLGWDSIDGAPDVAPGSSVVEITLTPDGADTLLALRHRGLPAATAGEHRSGWGHFLPILAAVAEATTRPD